MYRFPWGSGRIHDDQPRTWLESQEFIERPRMMRETDAEYAHRRAIAMLSAEILASLSEIARKQRWR